MNTENLDEIIELGHVAEVNYGFTYNINLSSANMAYNQILIISTGPDPHQIMHVFYLDGVFQFATCHDKTVHKLEDMPELFEYAKSYKYENA